MPRVIVDCAHPDWREQVHAQLFRGNEVDLINFDFEQHLDSCALLSEAFKVEFTPDRDPRVKAAQFRRR